VLLERLQASPGSPELQNGGVIALGEACDESLIGIRVFLAVTWLTVYRQSQVEAFFVKSGRFLCSEASSGDSRRC
jgi:hypothetical protein